MKFLAKVAAFGLVIGFLCSGCGTGVTLLPIAGPMISQVSPQVVMAGTSNVTVTVQGANFLAQSSLTVNGTAVPTTVVNSTTLAAKISGNALAQPTVAQLQVQNSDGVRSNQVPFTVAAAQQGLPPLTIANTQLPVAQVGTPYNQPLTVTGGTPGYTWAISSGSLPAGFTLSSGGVLSGSATASGNFTFNVTVSDSGTPQSTKTTTFSIAVTPVTVTPSALTIGSVALGSAQVGVTYSHTLNASGGTPNYIWSITSGNLPTGLSLSSAGVLSGTPTASGTATFTVAVQDSGSPAQTTTAQESITVAAPGLAITTTSLAAGKNGTSYNATLSATGGTPNYTWSIASGSLPAGLSLSNAGVISGTPTASGTAAFTVAVQDSGSPAQTTTAQESITVAAPGLAITTTSLAAGKNGTSYNATLGASGGTPNYTWSIASGSLPAGLSLSGAGVISGTPTGSGTATFTVAVQDSGSPAQTTTAQESITVAAPGLAITTTNLVAGKNGTSYSATLGASGGTPNYTWSIASGSLPAGLSLSNAGVISGTPTASGTATFTVAVQDSGSPSQTTSAQESITVAAAQSTLTIASTSLSATQTGGSYSATLSATGGTPGYTWSLASGSLPAGLTLSSAGVISGTPTASGTATFTVAVQDSGSPAQTASAQESIAVAATPLTITSTNLAAGTNGGLYDATLSASGGTPSYSWTVTSGSLPAGLTLSSAGVISGTPTASGTATFTVGVSDAASPVDTASAQESITINTAGPGTTWFVRQDGGTRYSVNVPNGQCDGQADVPYPGNGVNQHCAFNDVRYMWMDGTYGNSQWAMAGGDTLVIRGCAALPSQQNPDAPHCRIGWDKATGNDAENFWCAGVSAFWGCSMPPPPNGTATQHTRILGACAYGTYSCNPVIGYPYTNNNLTQLFGGFVSGAVMYLNGSSYVDVEGLEITSHNGACTRVGAPAYPAGCSTSVPESDFASWGIVVTNTTSNITLQDLYIHGFADLGIGGPIGGPFTLNRVSIDFNAFAGWNFDDGYSTPNAPGSSLTQSYVTMVGNGCLEEYPIAHPQFPAKACWDSNSGGFGDAWSGQNTTLDSFTCDHCQLLYNVKDAAMGPHTIIHNISLTNSIWSGNMGQNGKWGQDANATFLFQNNLILGNCMRMSQALPGAPQNYAQGTGLDGSYLTNFCRAAGDVFDYFSGPGSTVNFNNNTVVTYQPTVFDLGCATSGGCGTTPYNFTNNLILGYTTGASYYPGSDEAPGLYYLSDSSVQVVGSHNVEYGVRNGDACLTNGIICSDPLLVNEPAQGSVPPETALDNFNFHPGSGSPAISAGTSYSGAPTTDYYGNPQTSPLTIGAVGP